MNNRFSVSGLFQNTWFRIGVLIWIALVVLRETGIIRFNYHRSSTTQNASLNWSATDNRIRVQGINSRQTYQKQTPSLCIYCDGECIWGDCENATATLQMQCSTPTMLWLPLFKQGDYSASLYGTIAVSETGNVGNDYVLGGEMFTINGRIDGSISVKGICSRYTAKRLIQQAAASYFGEEIVKRLNQD